MSPNGCVEEVSEMVDQIVQNELSTRMPENQVWDLVIKPKRGLFEVNLKEVWEYRDLLVLFVKRDIITVYKQTVLGPLWFFLQPVMTTLTYVVVFGEIANISTDGVPSPLFYLCGIIIWNYYQDCFLKTSSTFTANSGIFGKVYFPRLIVPMAQVVSGIVKFGIQFLLFLAVWCWCLLATDSVRPNFWVFSAAYCLLLMAGMGIGLGVLVSSMTTKYRDLSFLIGFGVNLLMYATPVIYPMSIIPERYRIWLWWNPFAHVIEAFKFGFLGAGSPSVLGLAYASVFTVVIVGIGVVVFNKTEQTFMDTV